MRYSDALNKKLIETTSSFNVMNIVTKLSPKLRENGLLAIFSEKRTTRKLVLTFYHIGIRFYLSSILVLPLFISYYLVNIFLIFMFL